MTTAKAVLDQARAWLGKNEKDGTHKEIIDIYNRIRPLPRGYKLRYTDSWCAATISALAIVCNATEIIPIECSCGRMISLAQQMGIWNENDDPTPSPGAIILYNWDDTGKGDDKGWPDHIGIVEGVENGVITVIEGNYNNAVGRRKIAVNGRYIRGYICPKYASEADIASEDDKKAVKTESAPAYYPQYTGGSNSVVDALKSLKIDSSKAHRTAIAIANGISDYTGTAAQNTSMLKLLKQGKLIKE